MPTYVDPYKASPAAQAASQYGLTQESSSGSTTGTSNSTQNTNTNSSTQNMDPTSLAALQLLIKQLMTGGTQGQIADKTAKDREISSLTTQRYGYSKEAAFADAQGLMAKTMRETLEKLMPGINSAAMGSGASQSSMRALLTQKAALEAGENASAQGLQAATAYGGVANGMSSAIGNLLNQADPVTAALLSALNIAKGAVSNTQGSGTTTTKGSTTGTSTNTGTTVKSPGSTVSTGGSSFMQQGNSDGAVSETAVAGTTQRFLQELYGNNAFSGVTF